MGDRAVINIEQGMGDYVSVYSHWAGPDMVTILADGLADAFLSGNDRADGFLTGNIIASAVAAKRGTLGVSVGNRFDSEYPVITVRRAPNGRLVVDYQGKLVDAIDFANEHGSRSLVKL